LWGLYCTCYCWDKVWTYAFGNNEEFYAPTVASGKVYVGSGDNNLYTFDAYDGTKLWNYTTGGKVKSCPAVSNDIVYVACNDGNLYAIDAITGTKIWNYTTGKTVPSWFESSPAIADDVVYVGSNTHTVYALDAFNGEKIWNTSIGWMFSTPAVAYGYVYVTDHNNLYALDASTGAKIWNFAHYPGLFPEYSSPTVADGIVYIGTGGDDSYSGLFYAFNAYTGEKIEQIEMSSKVFSTPAISHGMVYVASAHRLYAMSASRFTDLSPLELTAIGIAVVTILVFIVYFYRRKQNQSDTETVGKTSVVSLVFLR
jgi:outer membrane protein assembly factor BamB